VSATGLGEVADLASTVIARIWPDKTEQEKAELSAALLVVQGQLQVNAAQAGNASVFVSGARPFIMWVCGVGCAWNWIGLPVAKLGLAVAGQPLDIAPADLSEMMPLLLGMLGLGGFRTIEKIRGVASK
jgi:Holin of 3TMs, for gene-transfer release